MKIKFIKDYRFIGNDPDDGSDTTVKTGSVVDLENDESTKWLIDNGFAEEVKESGWWKPKNGDTYYVAYPDGLIASCTWDGCTVDLNRFLNGAVFKTEGAAGRWRDYLKAIATVRQDEGVLTPEKVRETLNQDGTVYTVGTNATALSVKHFYNASAGAVYFDTIYNANTSIGNHLDEWKIIANYDWSRE